MTHSSRPWVCAHAHAYRSVDRGCLIFAQCGVVFAEHLESDLRQKKGTLNAEVLQTQANAQGNAQRVMEKREEV